MGWVVNATPQAQKLTVAYLLGNLPLISQNRISLPYSQQSALIRILSQVILTHIIASYSCYDTQNHAALWTAIDSQISFLTKPLSCTAQSTVLYLSHSKYFYRFKSTGWFRSKGQYFGMWYYRSLWGKKLQLNMCLVPNDYREAAVWIWH